MYPEELASPGSGRSGLYGFSDFVVIIDKGDGEGGDHHRRQGDCAETE